jgi:hypothetical protein
MTNDKGARNGRSAMVSAIVPLISGRTALARARFVICHLLFVIAP